MSAAERPSIKPGFTLAEVLITLGIIGVVAAMTIPLLVNKFKVKVLETGFKKSYANLENAYILTKASLGVTNLRETYAVCDENGYYPLAQIFYDEFNKNIKVTKTVKFYPFTNYNGTKKMTSDVGLDMPKALNILPDGSSIGVWINASRFNFWVDTNGPYKKPNRYGFDIFEFQVSDASDKIKPLKPLRKYTEEELENEAFPELAGFPCDSSSTQGANGSGCSWFAINNINPDNERLNYWDNLPK